jgi:hypothetical protein
VASEYGTPTNTLAEINRSAMVRLLNCYTKIAATLSAHSGNRTA